MDPRTDRLLNLSSLAGLVALGAWVAFVLTDDARAWLAVAVVTTVACATLKLQASFSELESRLPVDSRHEQESPDAGA